MNQPGSSAYGTTSSFSGASIRIPGWGIELKLAVTDGVIRHFSVHSYFLPWDRAVSRVALRRLLRVLLQPFLHERADRVPDGIVIRRVVRRERVDK